MEQLKNYTTCLQYCALDKDSSEEEKAECILQIREDYDRPDFCTVIEGECSTVSTPQFKQLVLLMKEILKFIYVIRKNYGNTFDTFIIPVVASIPLEEFNLSINDLACVDFPGDGTVQEKFPKKLSEYITLFRQLINQPDSGPSNMESWVGSLEKKRTNMNIFIKDFQPWSRTLMNFVIVQTGDDTIPPIGTIAGYGSFIKDVEEEYLSFFKQLQKGGFMKTESSVIKAPMLRIGHKKLIRFLMGKLPPAPKYVNIPKPPSTNKPRWKLGGTRKRKNKRKHLQRTKKRK